MIKYIGYGPVFVVHAHKILHTATEVTDLPGVAVGALGVGGEAALAAGEQAELVLAT